MSTFSFWSAILLASSALTVGCASGSGDEPAEGGDGDGDAGDGDGDTGSGGAAGDGDGSGGADTGPVSVCDGATDAPADAVVSDLETSAMGWDIYASTPEADGADGAELTAPASGDFEDPPELVADAADDSTQALHFAGTGWATYGAGLNYNLEGCKDLTAYTGVRFWVKGSSSTSEAQTEAMTPPSVTDNTVNFRVITAGAHGMIDVDGVNVGGDCVVTSGKCFMPPQVNIPLTEEWVMHEIAFEDLTTPSGANPGSAFDGTNAMLLGWHSEPANFDLYIDEVEFY
jgi:hypothetical protein